CWRGLRTVIFPKALSASLTGLRAFIEGRSTPTSSLRGWYTKSREQVEARINKEDWKVRACERSSSSLDLWIHGEDTLGHQPSTNSRGELVTRVQIPATAYF